MARRILEVSPDGIRIETVADLGLRVEAIAPRPRGSARISVMLVSNAGPAAIAAAVRHLLRAMRERLAVPIRDDEE